jgi:signal transduction histidine kinase
MSPDMRVLLIEDNPGDVALVGRALSSQASAPVLEHVGSLREAQKRLSEPGIDAVILDLTLPDSTGVAGVQKLAREFPALPLVVLTGLDDERVGLQALQEGAQDYLVKDQLDGRLLSRALRYAALRKGVEEMARQSAAEQAARAEAERLSRMLVEIQEAERRQVARELHDEVGQLLTGVKLFLEVAARQAAGSVKTAIVDSQGLIDELTARVRNMSLDLRPAVLDDYGLKHALLWYLERYTSRTNMKVAFEHTGLEKRFATEAETAAYRIVQEALTNVARHAEARTIRLQMWADEQKLWVQVEDDGRGFVTEAAPSTKASSGVSGMHERAALLGGRLTIESQPGQGTRITAELPVS